VDLVQLRLVFGVDRVMEWLELGWAKLEHFWPFSPH